MRRRSRALSLPWESPLVPLPKVYIMQKIDELHEKGEGFKAAFGQN